MPQRECGSPNKQREAVGGDILQSEHVYMLIMSAGEKEIGVEHNTQLEDNNCEGSEKT